MDKTGTLTRNELAVAVTRAMPGFDEGQVLALAARDRAGDIQLANK